GDFPFFLFTVIFHPQLSFQAWSSQTNPNLLGELLPFLNVRNFLYVIFRSSLCFLRPFSSACNSFFLSLACRFAPASGRDGGRFSVG
ncbi:hypothetical protein, partial [uncultured Desulfovibrio sp.]|uniref:hypothetical protein n=1 Tax=uncultured Desulfovibrio sp. TaxID=167968 RepID=UPI002628D1C7